MPVDGIHPIKTYGFSDIALWFAPLYVKAPKLYRIACHENENMRCQQSPTEWTVNLIAIGGATVYVASFVVRNLIPRRGGVNMPGYTRKCDAPVLRGA